MPVMPFSELIRSEITDAGIDWDDEALALVQQFTSGELKDRVRFVQDAEEEEPDRVYKQALAFARELQNAAIEIGASRVTMGIARRVIDKVCPGFWPWC